MHNSLWVGGSIGRRGFPMLGTGKRGLSTYIKDIFSKGEQGFFYDPSALKTQYQDAAGTAAVSATGQPLGLVLDKSKGLALGVNIQSNGTGDSISGWNTFGAGLSLQNGTFRMNGVGSGTVVAAPNLPLVSGRLYAVSMSIKADVPTNTVSLNFRKKAEPSISISKQNPAMSLDTTYKTITVFLSTDVPTADTALCFRFSGTEVINVDWIEVHELAGNHAYQTTSAARPIFRQKPILGSELVTTNLMNGQPATGSTQFYSMSSRMAQLSAGKTYNINYTVKDYAGTGNVGLAGAAPAGVLQQQHTANGTYSSIQTPNANGYFSFFTSATNTANFSDISVKEITGYLTDQSYLAFDGVDDKLLTNLPTPLTNATVLRAVPGVGTEVKYNQTLPMLYEDSTNHAGLIAINRALTRKEQLRIMEELDKRAGAVGFDTTLFKTFDNNQEGFVFDPNDLSTMYQDAAGTMPVTGVGQPVGLVLDKSRGLLLGENVVVNGGFDLNSSGWNISNGGWSTVDGKAVLSGNGTAQVLYQNTLTTGKWYHFSFDVQSTGGDIGLEDSNGAIVARGSTGRVSGYYLANGSRFGFKRYAGNVNGFIDNVSMKELQGNHAYQTTSASRPILRQNATTGAYYLEFDGSDDFLVTNNINFTSTDKVSLFAGVQKLSDKSSGAVAELSESTMNSNGSFGLFAPNVGSDVTSFLKGSGSRSTSALDGYAAPASVLVTAKFDISGNNKQYLKVNSAVRTSTVSAGSGSFGNYPLYIGRRGGTQYPLNGHIYGLIGIGKLTSDSETEAIEKELAKRTGVTLNV